MDEEKTAWVHLERAKKLLERVARAGGVSPEETASYVRVSIMLGQAIEQVQREVAKSSGAPATEQDLKARALSQLDETPAGSTRALVLMLGEIALSLQALEPVAVRTAEGLEQIARAVRGRI